MMTSIHALLSMVYSTGYTPTSWQINEVVNIPKTDKESNKCGDYRPISLSSTIQKVLNGVLNRRLLSITTTITSNNQTGYKTRRDRSEPIIGLYDYLDTPTTRNPNNRTKYTAFVDLAKAFNSIPHDKLLIVLEYKLQQQNTTFCNYIKGMYSSLYYYNNVESELSDQSHQQCGIKQGCTISSTLFIIYFDLIVDSLSQLMQKEPLQHFIAAYADDLTISCDSEANLSKYMALTTN
jgi:hypothetical protein